MPGRKRVLVVDDDPAIRTLVAGLLVDAGYDAQTALDGDHARRSSIALHPDLIILDVHVPEKAMALRFVEAYRDRVPAESRRAGRDRGAGREQGRLFRSVGRHGLVWVHGLRSVRQRPVRAVGEQQLD